MAQSPAGEMSLVMYPTGLLRGQYSQHFSNNLDNKTQCTLRKCADSTELGGVSDAPDGISLCHSAGMCCHLAGPGQRGI